MRADTPELDELVAVLGASGPATALASAAGGWRTLSAHELEVLGLTGRQRRRVLALQRLVRHGYPELERRRLATPETVASVYGERLGALTEEVMIVVALNGRCEAIAELEVARGGRHGMVLAAAEVLRPLIRAGASAFILVHNHPSGHPEPSDADVEMTVALAAAADIVGVPMFDHVIVAAFGGGFTSLADLGVIQSSPLEQHEQAAAEQAL